MPLAAPDFDYIAGACGNSSLMALTRALGGRSLDHGVRVVGINPGPVDTGMAARTPAHLRAAMADVANGDPAAMQALYSRRELESGTTADAVWNLDGVEITDMGATGQSPTYFNFDNFEDALEQTAQRVQRLRQRAVLRCRDLFGRRLPHQLRGPRCHGEGHQGRPGVDHRLTGG